MRTRYTRGNHHRARGLVAAATTSAALLATFAAPALAATGPDVGRAISYLTAPANLLDGTHYEGSYTDSGGMHTYTDYGDTINTAFGLAAAGTDNSALQKIVTYMAANAEDYDDLGSGSDSPGAAGKLATLAESVGENPRSFGGQDLIGALDGLTCTASGTDCAAAGAYKTSYLSTISQAFGVLAQLRAGDTTNAASPVSYLESQQGTDGAWPSALPSAGGSDVDSTAMAAMALSLAPGSTAASAVTKANSYLVARQAPDGGFSGTSGESINSTALALLSLNLESSSYQMQITKGLAFLAAQQNRDGGFNVAAGQPGSDILASSQALSGALLTPFGTLSDPYGGPAPSLTVSSGPAAGTTYQAGASVPTLKFTCSPASGGTLASGLSGCSARVDGGAPQASGIALPTSTGAHTVLITATDSDDRYVIRTITYQVVSGTTSTTTSSPTLTHVTQSHSTWRTSSEMASISRASVPVGTTFGFTLNEPATVTLTFTRRLPGRRVGHVCDTPTGSNRSHPRCTITLTAKLTVHGGRKGANQVKFYGRLSRRLGLGAGSYTVAFTATAAGHTSRAQRLSFTVV